MYIQKSVSENAQISVLGVEKCKKISGGRIPPNLPTSTYDFTPNFFSPTTICHLSTLSIVWSLFVDAPRQVHKKVLCSNHFAV
jgi:hypothetical protein